MLSLKDEKRGTTDGQKIGELLIRERLITGRQLEEALRYQQARHDPRPLGEICRELGFITRNDLWGVILKYRKQIFLGDLLLRLGLLKEDQLKEVLETQRASGRKLGEILIEKKLLSESALENALKTQAEMQEKTPANALADKTLLKEVNAAFLRKRRVLPLFHDKEKGVLTVMMEDPTDIETISDLEKMFKTRIEPTVLTAGAVDHMINDVFDVWM